MTQTPNINLLDQFRLDTSDTFEKMTISCLYKEMNGRMNVNLTIAV